ncbi:MAG: thiamine pyrophosphate-dependent enzyme, partial [Chloroflexota bacterium]|nr:thiamine pyrophosphate-dependent enzyme [Chloroflexota bacterium]
MSNLSEFHGPNVGYVLELYERYQRDPSSVNANTRALFEHAPPRELPAVAPTQSEGVGVDTVVGAARLGRLTREYGHLAARIDPLGSDPPGDPELELATHGLTEDDLRRLPPSVVGGPLASQTSDALEAVRALQSIYCGSTGYDFDQIQRPEERDWLRDAVETQQFAQPLEPDEELELLHRLTMVETFERFLHRSFPAQKWFSIEGLDMLVPMMYEVILNAADVGTREVVIGIAHRGRLNVLAHILGLSYEAVLAGFQHGTERRSDTAASDAQSGGWTGDVTYHLGATRRLTHTGGTTVMPITLVSNPSHLEYVDPVVQGRARAAQETRTNAGPPGQEERASLPLLIHGDAAFPGQGIVAETLNLSRLAGYRTGGTIHIIANNQLGFTTNESEARSTLYASDLAKGFEIPIVHVNADDAAACIAAACLAHAYRERF